MASSRREEILGALRRRKGILLGSFPGADLLAVTNASRFEGRMVYGYLPFGDANAIVLERAREAVAKAEGTPVLAGVCATDPMRLMEKFLEQVKQAGFAGVQNFPTVGLIDGVFRANLEANGMGYAREVEMVEQARGLDLLTAPIVFDEEQAGAMAKAGADLVVAHPGVGRGTGFAKMAAAAREARRDVLVLAHVANRGEADRLDGADGFSVEGAGLKFD